MTEKINDVAMQFVRQNEGVCKLEKEYYTSPRISSEFMDCSLPMTFDQYNYCLSGETYIHTLQGRKKIKDIKVGDEVWSYNTEKQKYEISKVTNTMNRIVDRYLKITVGKKTLLITDNHKIFTKRGWVEAQKLTTDDEVLMLTKSDSCRMAWSDESKEKMRKRMTGTTHTEETKRKIRNAILGKHHSKETRKLLKKRWTQERKQKLKKFHKKFWNEKNRKIHSKKCKESWKNDIVRREKLSSNMIKNNPMRKEEIRRKQSESMKKAFASGKLDWLKEKLSKAGAENLKNYNKTQKQRKRVSERMKKNNPMKQTEIAKKMGDTMKKKYKSGEITPTWLGKKRPNIANNFKYKYNPRAITPRAEILPQTQLLLYECLNELNIPFIHECPIHLKDGIILVDALLPENNVVVEIDDIYHTKTKTKDKIRDDEIRTFGLQVLRIQVDNNFSKEKIKKRILENVG